MPRYGDPNCFLLSLDGPALKRVLTISLVSLLAVGDSAWAQYSAVPAASVSQTAAAVSATQAAPAVVPQPNTLMDGTAVKLRLSETISSAEAKTGQQVPFEVIEDVAVQGVTVIPKGTQALATVTDAEPKKRMGRGGKLDVNVDSTRLVDGEKVQLRAVKDNKGGGHVGAMTGAIVATSIVFFPAAPLFLLMHGKDITIPKGTEVTAFVQGDMRLEMAKMVAPGAVVPGSAAPGVVGAAAGAQMASLTVDLAGDSAGVTSRAGADIEIDGSFVGSTPSTVSVTPGQHAIVVKRKGYADWSRTMNVSGSGVRVSAEMEKVVAAR